MNFYKDELKCRLEFAKNKKLETRKIEAKALSNVCGFLVLVLIRCFLSVFATLHKNNTGQLEKAV